MRGRGRGSHSHTVSTAHHSDHIISIHCIASVVDRLSFPFHLDIAVMFLYALYFYIFSFQRHPTDKAYFIAKEILMTERTYKKDLEVINLVSVPQ